MRVLRGIAGRSMMVGALALVATAAGAQVPPPVGAAGSAWDWRDDDDRDRRGNGRRDDRRDRGRDGRGDDRRTLFAWTGEVDREVVLVMRGRNVSLRGDDRFNNRDRARVSDPLPRQRGTVFVRVQDGRGRVDVIEQPSPRNDYTTVVRITDPRGGADRYRLVAYWEGDGWYGDDDRDGRWNRSRTDGPFPGRGRDEWPGRSREDDRPGRGRDDDRGRAGNDPRWPNGGLGSTGQIRWSGQVDDIVDIRIQGRQAQAITRNGASVRGVRFDIAGAGLPRRDVTVDVTRVDGRGTVTVVQQPSAFNDYTAIIRVRDPNGGYGGYSFDARW